MTYTHIPTKLIGIRIGLFEELYLYSMASLYKKGWRMPFFRAIYEASAIITLPKAKTR